MDRLGIYLFYDKSGIVSPHIPVALDAFRQYFSRIVVVVNGHVTEEGFRILKSHCDSIVVRENSGFDVWGYKHVIEAIGFERISKYEEVVLFNYTFFAPVADLAPLFAWSEASDSDFWGITEYSDVNHHFVQSYFIAIRQTVLATDLFREYWTQMPPINSVEDSIHHHEKNFTKVFSEAGFKWSVCYGNEDDEVGNTTLAMPDILIRRGCPLLKYRALAFPVDNLQSREATHATKTLKTIREVSDYDTNLLESYLVRQIPPQQFAANFSTTQLALSDAPAAWRSDTRIAVVLRLAHLDQIELLAGQLLPLKARGNPVHWFISASEDGYAEVLAQALGGDCDMSVRIETEPRTSAGILFATWGEAVTDFAPDLIFCAATFEHPRKINSWARNRHEFYVGNLTGSDCVLDTVQALFDAKPHVGWTISPQAYYAERLIEHYWSAGRKDCRTLASLLGIGSWIEEITPVFAAGGAFWLRGQTLTGLLADYAQGRQLAPEMSDAAFDHAFGRIAIYLTAWRGQTAWRVISQDGLTQNLSGLEWGALQAIQGTGAAKRTAARASEDMKKSAEEVRAMSVSLGAMARQTDLMKQERDRAVEAKRTEAQRYTVEGLEDGAMRIGMNMDRLLDENHKLKAETIALVAELDRLRGAAKSR